MFTIAGGIILAVFAIWLVLSAISFVVCKIVTSGDGAECMQSREMREPRPWWAA